MKYLLLFSLVFNLFCLFSQEKVVFSVEKELETSDFYPHINHIYNGDIYISQLIKSGYITNNLNWKVISFKITYPSGRDEISKTILGDEFTEELIKDLVKSALKEQLFITEIKAIDENGKKHALSNMMLTLLPDEK